MFKIVNSLATCKCDSSPKKIKVAIKDFINSLINYVRLEEGDVIYNFGKLLGSLINKPYVSIIGDRETIEKYKNRLMSYGCIKNRNQLINGKCPSK